MYETLNSIAVIRRCVELFHSLTLLLATRFHLDFLPSFQDCEFFGLRYLLITNMK